MASRKNNGTVILACVCLFLRATDVSDGNYGIILQNTSRPAATVRGTRTSFSFFPPLTASGEAREVARGRGKESDGTSGIR
jgi:hypothetical protein